MYRRDLGYLDAAELMATDRGFLLLTREDRGQTYRMEGLSPAGETAWQREMPGDGAYHRGSIAFFVCVDSRKQTLRGVRTANGEVAWEERFSGGITHVSMQGDELVVEVGKSTAHRLALDTGRFLRKEAPIPHSSKLYIARLGDYLVSQPVIPEVLRTNFMLTRAYRDQRHLRTDSGAWRPPFAVLPEGLFFFGDHSGDQTDLALVDPAHHRLIWTAPWPFAAAPQNYILRGHKDLMTWADASHWVAYALDDGRIVGTGRKQKRDAVVVAHGVSATLEAGDRGRRALALRPLQVLRTDAALATRKPYRGAPEWFSPGHELTYLVSRDGGLDPEHGIREHRDIDAFVLNFSPGSGRWKVKWRLRADGRAPQGEFRVRQSASAGSAPLFTDLKQLLIQTPLEGHSVLMLPRAVFQRARAEGRAPWKDLHGGSDTLEYLGETWHQAAFEYPHPRLEIMPAHLFRSGNAEYRVVMSGDVPVVVYAHYGDQVVFLAEVKGVVSQK